MTRKKLLVRIALGVLLFFIGAGLWGAMNATAVRARYAAWQLRNASTEDERVRAAERLASLGEPGLVRLADLVLAGDEPCCAVAGRAIAQRLESLPDGDPWASAAAERLLGGIANGQATGERTVLELVPLILKRTGPSQAARCREVVSAALRSPDRAVRGNAVRLAIHPSIQLRAGVVPLLDDPEAEVRRAALVVVAGQVGGETLIADEDLFRWLHDPDEGVRRVCHDALVSRERTEMEIALGRRLTDPNPRERLRLLLDLRYDDPVADPEPWLERLSADREPAVRAGAARVAVEVHRDRRLGCPSWVSRIADADPDATVRRVARYFRSSANDGIAGGIRQVGGP